MIAWVARSHTLVVSGGVPLGFHCFSLGFLIISGFVFWVFSLGVDVSLSQVR